MTSYIFSFPYIDKIKMAEIKSGFLFNELSKSYSINFLTKKNFSSFFNEKHLSLKSILSGKYLIISSNDDNSSSLNILIKDIQLIQNFFKGFEEEIFLFGIIHNENYYTNEFLIESVKINNKKIFEYININIYSYLSSLLLIETIQYNIYLSRINNLNLLKQNNFISILY